MTQTPAPHGNPFTPGRVAPPKHFVGRQHELRTILARLEQALSIAVIGEARIGKSSLLAVLEARLPSFAAHGVRYVPLRLSMDTLRTKTDFCRAVLAGLLPHLPPTAAPESMLRALEQLPTLGDAELNRVAALAQATGLLPVLLLDEFKHLVEHPQEFDDTFLGTLRSLYSNGVVALVLATRQPLADIPQLNSYFANSMTSLTLRPLLPDEAEALIRLPSDLPFNNDEVTLCLQVGDLHPLRLQLAGFELYQAKRNTDHRYYDAPGQLSAQGLALLPRIVGQHFHEAMRLSQPRQQRSNAVFGWVAAFGQSTRSIGNTISQFQDSLLGVTVVIVGVVVLIGLALWLLGVLTLEQLGEFLTTLRGGS